MTLGWLTPNFPKIQMGKNTVVGQHVGLGRLDEYLKEIISSQRGMLSNRIRCLLVTTHMLHGMIYILHHRVDSHEKRTLCCCQLASRVLIGHIGISGDETRVLAGRMEFPHHYGDSQGRRTPPCKQLTPRVLAGHTRMSRDETRVLAGHRVLAGPKEFPHH